MENYLIEVYKDQELDNEGFKISMHYFGRIFYKFISPIWLFESNFEMIKKIKMVKR